MKLSCLFNIKLLLSISLLSTSFLGYSVSELTIKEESAPQVYAMGNYSNFATDSSAANLIGFSFYYDNPLNSKLGLETSFSQAFSSEGVLSSVVSKLDFGLNYKLLGTSKSGSSHKYNGADFVKVGYRPERSISVGAGLSGCSFNLFDSSLLLTGIYVGAFYKEPITNNLTFGLGAKFDYLSANENTLQVMSLSGGLTYKFSI